jgi:hypothetical protein
MQDSLLTAALILLIVAHGILIRSCYALHTQIPAESAEVRTRLDGVSELLDEALDLIADTLPAVGSSNAVAGPFEANGGSILSTLISNMLMPNNHASTTQQEEWEVLPPDEPPTTQ